MLATEDDVAGTVARDWEVTMSTSHLTMKISIPAWADYAEDSLLLLQGLPS